MSSFRSHVHNSSEFNILHANREPLNMVLKVTHNEDMESTPQENNTIDAIVKARLDLLKMFLAIIGTYHIIFFLSFLFICVVDILCQ